ncbi:hypothetical protein [Streptomyces sp. ISID311]|uniref:hypothetical protein n=1 Tax=Streptomyces sp. ISID311 TaxID=2601673 RepID=UPI0011BD37E1|nr:hypothetical protein [Streptomyces sp. ISID311]TXC98780.1 hypothetical protein FS847_05090 [Streptomyces sp. ISID311]
MGDHIKRPRRIAALAVALIATAGCAHGSGGVPDGGADGGHPAPGVVTEAPAEPGASKPSPSGHGGSASERQEGGGAAAGGAQGAPTGAAPSYGGDPVPPVKSPPVDQSVPPVHGGGVDPSGGGDGGGSDVGGTDVGGQTTGGGEQSGGACPPSEESPSPSDSPEATGSAFPSDSPSSDPSPAETCPSPSGT